MVIIVKKNPALLMESAGSWSVDAEGRQLGDADAVLQERTLDVVAEQLVEGFYLGRVTRVEELREILGMRVVELVEVVFHSRNETSFCSFIVVPRVGDPSLEQAITLCLKEYPIIFDLRINRIRDIPHLGVIGNRLNLTCDRHRDNRLAP